MTYLLIITLAPSPIPSKIPHTLFDIISLGVDSVLCYDQDTCKTVHTCARRKMPQYNIVNNVKLFSHDWFQGNSMCIDRRQSTQQCPYQMGEGLWQLFVTIKLSVTAKLHILYHIYNNMLLPATTNYKFNAIT